MSESLSKEVTEHLAYAESALLLLESLLLAMLQKQLLTLNEVEMLIQSALDTKQQIVEEDPGPHSHIAQVAAGVLTRLSNSFAALERR